MYRYMYVCIYIYIPTINNEPTHQYLEYNLCMYVYIMSILYLYIYRYVIMRFFFTNTMTLSEREVPNAGQVGLDTTLTWTLLGMSTSQFSVHRGPNRGLRGVVLFVKRSPGVWGDLLWSSCTYKNLQDRYHWSSLILSLHIVWDFE